mgnify:CR=1 FL=1
MKKKLLIICCHPDDEVLGCGASIYKFSKNFNIHCIYLTNGGTNRPKESIKNNIKSINKVKKILGIKKIYLGNFPDNQLDTVNILKLTQFVEKIVEVFKPELIFTHSSKDLNIDHQICNKVTLTACRPMKKNHYLKKILFFEILSSTEWNFKEKKFRPEVFINISKNQFNKKIRAMKQYKIELKKFPHPRSLKNIENLAKLRGSNVGFEYAEAFELGYEKLI